MATNFSPCKGSYVLNQFPSNVMFAMNGFTYQPVERYRAIMALLLRVCTPSVLKTLWGKEKLLVKSNFSFSHKIFNPFGELSAIYVKFEIVAC